jgi:dTDP-4-dehydrorhamnose 3,5-epimerase
MTFEDIFIAGLKVIQPRVFEDSRGYFYESYNQSAFESAGIKDNFVQSNQSLSQKGVLRGMHFQIPPNDQSKLVRVIKGAVLDVVVDIRKGSATYGKHFSIELRDETLFSYKCGNFYNKQAEQGLMWNDPEIGIEWNIDNPILSEKDTQNELLRDFKSPFNFKS